MNVNGIEIDLGYVVATRRIGDEQAVWRGPVVMCQGRDVYVDTWLGAGLSGRELPDMSDVHLATIETEILAALEDRGPASQDAVCEALSVEQVRAELDAVDVAAEIEDERRVHEVVLGVAA